LHRTGLLFWHVMSGISSSPSILAPAPVPTPVCNPPSLAPPDESLAVDGHWLVGLNSFLLILMMTAVFLIGYILRLRMSWLPESGAALLLGMLAGLFILFSEQETAALIFSPEIFFCR
jgi:hypothetical protein